MTRRNVPTRLPPNRPRPFRAAWLAFWALVVFAATHVYWGLGFRTGLTTFLAYEGQREAGLIASARFAVLGLWGVALLSAVAAAAAGAVLRGWDGRLIPRWAVLAIAIPACVVLAVRGGYGLVSSLSRIIGLAAVPDDVDASWFWLDALLLAPAFVAIGASFSVIAWDQWQRIKTG